MHLPHQTKPCKVRGPSLPLPSFTHGVRQHCLGWSAHRELVRRVVREVFMTWDAGDQFDVLISGVSSYSFRVTYDVPAGTDSELNYAWLNVENTGSGLVFSSNGPNYAASARTALRFLQT